MVWKQIYEVREVRELRESEVRMTPHQKKVAAYEAGNREAAAIILEAPAKFGGEESLTVMCARAVTAKASGETTDERELPLWRAA